MSELSSITEFTPAGWHTLTPRVVVPDPEDFVTFLKQVFAATGEYLVDRPTVLDIGDSKIMISDVSVRDSTAGFFYVYVSDVDSTFKLAVAFGVHVIEEPADLAYGDRRCMVKDRWDNIWQIATHLKS